MKISQTQRTLFDLDEFEIRPADRTGDRIGDWEWESATLTVLPNLKSREQTPAVQQPESKITLLPNLGLLPNLKSREQNPKGQPPEPKENLLPNFREQPPLLPKSREQETPKKQLPDLAIREQLERGETVIGYSIVKIKSMRYLLTHSKSNKYYPTLEGWYDIKIKRGIHYLYIRWREGVKQKSRCLGRVDLLE
jgi:hypothetical protein